MAVKYYSDGTYTKGDGKLYRPGIGVVGNDKSTNVSKAESGSSASMSSSSKTSSSSSKSSSSGGVSSMYKNNSSSSSSTSILDKMMSNVKNNPVSSGGSSSNVSKTDSGWYVPSGSVSTPVKEPEVVQEDANPYAQAYMDRLQSKYDALNEQIREQNRLAVEQGTNRLEAQKSNINQSAEENARQAYIQYMQSQKALPQQLASQGITGGATETASLGLSTNYQNNVNSINQNKANALQEIDNAIVDLKNSGDLAAVEQVLANNQAALDAYKSAYDKGVSYNQWAQQFNANREDSLAEQAYRDKVYLDNKAQQELENQWYVENVEREKDNSERDRILSAYANGYIDKSYAAAQLGVPTEALYDQKAYLEQANALGLKGKLMDISNTQSLISSRNSNVNGKNGNSNLISGEETELSSLEQNYYNLIDRINDKFYGNSTGKEASAAVISPNENNVYGINPNIHRGSYLDLIIAETLQDDSLSAEEKVNFLNGLEISDSDIYRVDSYLGGTGTENATVETQMVTPGINSNDSMNVPAVSVSSTKPKLSDYINYIGNGAGLNPGAGILYEAKENEENNPYTLKLQSYYKSLGLGEAEVAMKMAEYKNADIASRAKILRDAGIS